MISLRQRGVIGAILWITLALGASGAALLHIFDASAQRQFDANLGVQLEALTSALVLAGGTEGLDARAMDPRFLRPLSGYYWQIEGEGRLVRSRSLWDDRLELPPSVEDRVTTDLGRAGEAPLRLAMQRLTLPDGLSLVLAVAADQTSLEAERERFRWALAGSFGALAVALVAAAWLQLVTTLLPLGRLRRALGILHKGDAERIEGSYPAELAPLVDDLNELLSANRRLLERARRQAADLAHALKTPTAILRNALPRIAASEEARLALERIDAQVTRQLASARTGGALLTASARAPVRKAAERLAAAMRKIYATRDLTIEVRLPRELHLRGDDEDLEELLGNLLDNACKWARGKVRVSGWSKGSTLYLSVEDDGPGIPPELRAAVLEAGARLDDSKPGTGLGLAIVTDLVLAYRGHIGLDLSPMGGLRVALELPLATIEPEPRSSQQRG